MKNVQYIYLDNSHKQIAITKDGYQQIKQTIEQYRICCSCECLFSDENPQVTLNWCKECFVSRGEGKRHGLHYVGMVSPEPAKYNGIEHQFIAPDGYIYVTGSESEINHGMLYNKSIRHTLKHWKFQVPPEMHVVNEKEMRLHESYMSIYGDVCKDSALFIEYSETYTYAPNIVLLFLTSRNGECQEFNKRKGEGLKLWRAAKARLEASKDTHGDYHIGEYTRSWTHQSDIYHFMVDILRERATKDGQ